MSRPGSLARAWDRLGPRRPHGIVALLLPHRRDTGEADLDAFASLLARTAGTGLDVAVNMDTGFGDLLGAATRTRVLDVARETLGERTRFYAGAYPEGRGERPDDWHAGIEAITRRGARPVIVQSRAMHALGPEEKVAFYARILEAAADGGLGFELSPAFAPHGEIWSTETFTRMLELERLRGSKHSSLDRRAELERLAIRDSERPGYRIYTGNDLAIDMAAYGSDYLLGLATFAPKRFAERDDALATSHASFLALNDALQHLGNVGFRAPIPAYKHAAAQFLHIIGWLADDAIHPLAARRPGSERVLLYDCARRLDLLDDPERIWRERVEPFVDQP